MRVKVSPIYGSIHIAVPVREDTYPELSVQ